MSSLKRKAAFVSSIATSSPYISTFSTIFPNSSAIVINLVAAPYIPYTHSFIAALFRSFFLTSNEQPFVSTLSMSSSDESPLKFSL